MEERREAWKRRKVSVRYGQQSAQLRDICGFDPDQARWSFSSQQATLRRLDKAMAAFYRRCKAGQLPGYPRFKALDRWDSAEWPKDGDGCRWKPDTGRVYLQGIGHVKVHAHRPVEGRGHPRKQSGRRWPANRVRGPRNTSITCHQCGNRCLRPCQALVICPVHGGMDADVNGAKNIYTRAGLGSDQAATAA